MVSSISLSLTANNNKPLSSVFVYAKCTQSEIKNKTNLSSFSHRYSQHWFANFRVQCERFATLCPNDGLSSYDAAAADAALSSIKHIKVKVIIQKLN